MKKKTFIFLFIFLFISALVVLTASVPAQDPKTAEEELETFVPSEKVSADTSVPFPVDI